MEANFLTLDIMPVCFMQLNSVSVCVCVYVCVCMCVCVCVLCVVCMSVCMCVCEKSQLLMAIGMLVCFYMLLCPLFKSHALHARFLSESITTASNDSLTVPWNILWW